MSPLPAPEPRPAPTDAPQARTALRDQIAEALRDSITAWWQTPPRLDYAADAVLPVVEAALAEQAAEFDEDIITPERALHEQTIERAERAEAALQRVHAFATSMQEPGAPLFWPEMGRRIQQELDDHGAGSGRCPSCDHPVSLHQPDGCRFAVTEGTVGRDLVCPCSVPRTAPDQPEETP